MKRQINIFITCCTVLFCAGSAFGQGYDTCSHLKEWEYIKPGSEFEALQQYDNLRTYIEKCGASDSQSFRAFISLDAAVERSTPDDTNRYDRYRDWLIYVLYVNPMDLYFCTCMKSIMATYGYGKYHIPNASLAVLDYIRKNSRCATQYLDQLYQQQIDYRHKKWLEGDTTKPEDTTLPSLDNIGLGFLLKSNANPTPIPLTSIYLASFTGNPNPFSKEMTLQFTLSRKAYIQLAIYDELGRLVWGDGRGSSLEAGKHTVHIDGKLLPQGVLYARISTGFGEVKTVKLVHE